MRNYIGAFLWCNYIAAVYSCLVKTPATNTAHKNGDVAPSYMKRTMQDVIHLKHQIEDLKKESIKKEDLRLMEEKIAKIIRRAAKVDSSPRTSKNIKCIKHNQEITDGKLELCDENNKNYEMPKKKDVDISNVKKNVNNSSINPLARAYKNSNKMSKKLEQSFAVNVCLCSGKEAPSKLAQAFQRSNNLKAPRDLVTNIPSIKQTKPIDTLASAEKSNPATTLSIKTVCPSNCICFHKIPSNSSIDKLLEILSKWNGSLNEIPEDTKFSSNQIENGNKSLLLDSVRLETNKNDNNESSKSVHQTSMSNQFSKEEYSKEDYNNNKTCENVLPPTIESEYLGAINLDKSNYNICRCPVTNDMKIKHGDNKMLPDNVPFQCINADVCKCKSFVLSEQLQETKHYEYVPSKIKKVSHAYSVELDKVQFKCTETETDSLNKKNSTKSVEISEDTFIHDVVRQSQLFPNDCDYFVKFLGVTLTNSSSTNKTKHGHDNNTLKTSSKVTKNKDKNTIKEGSSNIKTKNCTTSSKNSELSSSLENCENTDFNLDCLTKDSRRVLDTNKDACVCCNNKETSKDLELNAFKLLEEHIKRKLEELLRSSSKSSCLPPEEESKLFNTILFKVKEVISESTKSLSCKCCEQNTNEGSWSRAYGMLQEYLKVKIKRVQCSCVESLSDGNVESILPPILKKVCDLIENDFQRLKEKCECDNDNEKLNKISFIKNNICSTEKFNIMKNADKETNRCVENILQRAAVPVDRSCEVLENSLLNLSTSEKNMSCEFKIYGTDCNCQHTFTESSVLQKDNIVNQCTDLKSLNVIGTLSTSEIQHPMGNSLLLKKSIPINEHNERNVCFFDCTETESKLKAKVPYIGYTLSSKSLVQNNTDKIDCIWKLFTGKTCPRNCSYIMDKVLTNIKSENNINNLLSHSCRKNTYNIEVSTFDNDKDLVLKYSNDKDTDKTFDETSAGTKNNNIDNSSCIDECEHTSLINDNNYDIDKYNTKFLYDSLHLPTPMNNLTKQFENGNIYIDDIFEKEQDKCDCKTVPICHVKMLVNSIEKKLIQSKCTCDSLNSQVCPVHSLEI